MGIIASGNTLLLVSRLLDRKKSVEPIIRTKAQKPPFGEKIPIEQPFLRGTPESVGIDSAYIADFLSELRHASALDLHNIIIAKDKKIICEASFGGYDREVWHVTHSECKSVTSLAVGMLIDEGKLSLDDKIVKIFEDEIPRLALVTHRHISVRHLLTMTSGVSFNETGAVTEEDWVRKYFESGLRSEPGKRFHYNSMNSYILSAIVKKVSGVGLCEYLEPRLFAPLGIKKYHWGRCPRGIEKGGWGLYILPEDILKIAELVLDGGVWNGRRLISKEYLDEATSLKVATPDAACMYGYGYHIWAGEGKSAGSFLFNGMFGQNVIGFKNKGILLLENAGNDEIFQQSSFFVIANKYFGADTGFPAKLKENGQSIRKLQKLERGLIGCARYSDLGFFAKRRAEKRLAQKTGELCGKRFVPLEEEAASVGLLPLVTQAVQNNYTKGLKSLVFDRADGKFRLTVNESDESYVLPVGFFAPEYTDLVFHGEPYLVAVQGEFCENEDAVPVLKIRISFLEEASARTIKIFFFGDRTVAKFSENPGRGFIDVTLGALKTGAKGNPIAELIMSHADPEPVIGKLNALIEPTLTLVQK